MSASQWIFICIGSLLTLDTVAVSFISHFNAGVIMPAVLGLPLLCYGLFQPQLEFWFATPLGAGVKIVVSGLYLLFLACLLVAIVLIQTGIHGSVKRDADALVVLGAAVWGETPSLVLQSRLDTALEYYEQHPCTIVVTGGKGGGEEVTEAWAMKKYLVERGVPEEDILMEERASSTYENFLYSKAILEEAFPQGYEAVYVTTSFHVYRAGLIAKDVGMPVAGGLAAPYRWYMAPNYYLRETLSIGKYFLLGN